MYWYGRTPCEALHIQQLALHFLPQCDTADTSTWASKKIRILVSKSWTSLVLPTNIPARSLSTSYILQDKSLTLRKAWAIMLHSHANGVPLRDGLPESFLRSLPKLASCTPSKARTMSKSNLDPCHLSHQSLIFICTGTGTWDPDLGIHHWSRLRTQT